LVAEIACRRSDAVVFDPELIGYVLRKSVAVPTEAGTLSPEQLARTVLDQSAATS
jgi:hypothetical protein